MRIIVILLFKLSVLSIGSAQIKINIELQAYPTGLIPGLRVEHSLNEKHTLNMRLGVNLFDHRDLGVQDSEKGWGLGGSIG